MANFDNAIKTVMKHEGGYANDPLDRGGETYRGIARRFHPRWEGWAVVDAAKRFPGFITKVNTNPRLYGLAIRFYRDKFWRYEGVASQRVAIKVFDAAVNMGSPNAHRILQRALRHLGFKLKVDGQLGLRTLRATNQSNEKALLLELRAYAAVHYAKIVARKPNQVKWLYGWMQRAVS